MTPAGLAPAGAASTIAEVRPAMEGRMENEQDLESVAFDLEGTIIALEVAHAALALRVAKLLAESLGWTDVDISSFLNVLADDVTTVATGLGMGRKPSLRFAGRLREAGETLHPMPAPWR